MNVFYTPLYCVTLVFAFLLSPFVRKVKAGVFGRLGLSARLGLIPHTHPLYWFHVASSGEFEQVLPLLETLKTRAQVTVLLTYFSPTASRAIILESQRLKQAGKAAPWDFADYLPYDLPWTMKRTIKTLKPKAFVAIHRELWPNLFKELHQAKVPAFLFSTFWPERTQKSFLRYKDGLKTIRLVGTVDEKSRTFIQSVLPEIKVETLGDPRVDRVFHRKNNLKRQSPWKDFLTVKKNIILASVWNEDLLHLFKTVHWITGSQPHWRVILVPHEIRRTKLLELQKRLNTASSHFRLWSQWIRTPDDHSHLIIDEVGFLAELYSISEFVFVGGSFKGRIHNVLEPGVYAKPVLAGPHIWNSAEACELNETTSALRTAETPQDLLDLTKKWMEDPSALEAASKSIKTYLENKRGAASRYIDALLREVQ